MGAPELRDSRRTHRAGSEVVMRFGQLFPCTELRIGDAIAEGVRPHTFDCDGSTTVVTEASLTKC